MDKATIKQIRLFGVFLAIVLLTMASYDYIRNDEDRRAAESPCDCD